ncbi:DUF6461 domain-containing protein [Pimelobacter simplex]|uniref:DUF6461 domain-containing protein n=1 Tax=Nocardioides simplex TaxID=2045 RepID=UPI00366E3D80
MPAPTPADQVASYAWLSDELEAGCLSVVVGSDASTSAECFGIDRDDPVSMDSERWFVGPHASVVETDGPVSIVLEDNGFEGSRSVVLRPASKGGKAASIFWNVNGMVIFSCARRGKVLWSGELGMEADLDGLPRSLVRFAELADADDDVDPVAVGAAMVAAFTGVEVTAGPVEDAVWCAVSPQVEQPEAVTAETSSLRWDHPELLDALVTAPPAMRRPLVHALVHAVVHQASLAENEVAAAVLASVAVDGPGSVPPALDAWERQQARESDRLWVLQDDAVNAGGDEPLREEELRVYRPGYVISALRYACHVDDLSALLGAANAAVAIFGMDDLEPVLVAALASAARAEHAGGTVALAGLPTPPSAADRAAALEEQRRARDEDADQAALAEEREHWGGRPPSARMRAAATGGAHALAQRNRPLLDLLEPLDDDVLTAIRDQAAHAVLAGAGLLDLPWVVAATTATDPVDLGGCFQRLFSDPDVVHTDFLGPDGQRWSRQSMALPVLAAFGVADPYDGACHALAVVGDGPRDEAAAIYQSIGEQFGLEGRA